MGVETLGSVAPANVQVSRRARRAGGLRSGGASFRRRLVVEVGVARCGAFQHA